MRRAQAEEQPFAVRAALRCEHDAIGELLVRVYADLPGFPSPTEQPAYYAMLASVGTLASWPGASLLVASNGHRGIAGAVVYFKNMQFYGSGGIATSERDAAGFRLLAVDPRWRGHGIGTLLTRACIAKARADKRSQVIIHTTMAMQQAWVMYERMGFRRSSDLDFMQGELPVFGFRLDLSHHG